MDTPRRYHTIDAIRGVAVISMVLYHLYYDIFCLFGGHTEYCWLTPIYLWERSICVTFIVISGVSLNFSRHGYRRGLIVAGCAMVVTLVTYVMYPDEAIWFGVLHLLSFSMLLTTALRPLLDKIKPIIGMIVFFILFMLCYGIPDCRGRCISTNGSPSSAFCQMTTTRWTTSPSCRGSSCSSSATSCGG